MLKGWESDLAQEKRGKVKMKKKSEGRHPHRKKKEMGLFGQQLGKKRAARSSGRRLLTPH